MLVNHHMFRLGNVSLTPAAHNALQATGEHPGEYISRHARGDFGLVNSQENTKNLDAIINGEIVASRFYIGDNLDIMIATLGDRSETLVMLRSEYSDYLLGTVHQHTRNDV